MPSCIEAACGLSLGGMTQMTRLAPSGSAESLRQASVSPASWNETDRSFEVVWTTGAAVTRFDWFDGEAFDETLSTDPAHVRLDRLQAGGPVLLDHEARTQSLAGSVVPGSVRFEKGNGVARVRLADTPDIANVVGKIRDGHLRTVSVGYLVHAVEHTPGKKGERARMHVIDWEPIEISLVPVPADAGASVRKRNSPMPQTNTDNRDDPRNDDTNSRRASRRRSVTEDQIIRACSRAQLSRDFERSLIDGHEEDPMTEAELLDAISGEIGKRRNSRPINSNDDPHGYSGRKQRDLFADVLAARLSGKPVEGEAANYAGASVVDMARSLLEERGEHVRWARASTVIDRICRGGQHSTDDFAYLLKSAGHRYLIEAFSSVPSPLKKIARKRDFPDFRKRYAIQAEGPSSLRLVPENAEFKRVSVNTGQNGAQLATYGEIFAISRQALVNDDLGAFQQMALFWARAHAETESSYLSAMITGTGATLEEDGKALYHADHGNLAASGSAITVASISAARLAMRNMKNRDGVTPANVTPKFLVVGPAKETEADQLVAATTPAAVDAVNPFGGKLEVAVDPHITDNSWRLFASPETNPVIEYGNLEGEDGLYTDTRTGFDVDGVEFKARIDIGAGLVDWRGTYMNPGD